jgi:hypothetical protein
MSAPESKTCTKCDETKPLSEYYRQANCRGGHRPDCKDCVKARTRATKATPRAKESDEERRRDAEYRKAAARRSRAYYKANRAARHAYNRAYYLANPEAIQRGVAKRRARKLGVEHQPYTRTEIFDRDGGWCRGCRRTLTNEPYGFEIDHIVPLSLGGPDTPANVQLMCRSCNREKWNRLEGQIHMPI